MQRTFKALVIEDDPDAAAVAVGMLRVLGYDPTIAADGHAALYSLADSPPELILLDLCLPHMDGVTLMRVARRVEETQTTPVVACSAVYPPDSSVAGVLRSLGVHCYLAKPFNMAALRSAVRLADPTGPAGSANITRGTMPAAPPPRPPRPDPRDEEQDSDPAAQTATLVLQLEDTIAVFDVGGRKVPMLVVRAAEGLLDVRSAEAVFNKGDEVRAAISIGEVVSDSMVRTDVRLLGRIDDAVTSPRGVRYRVAVRLIAPDDGLQRIANLLANQ